MNKLIINDNLITLKSLDDNSIDCIYTDPPYLTGNSKLTYKDNKPETEWIEFMRERLVECKRVMKKSATMLIHIDENMHVELANLCYQVFGKKNHITTFIWKKRTSSSSQSKFASVEHEYIIAVAKDIKHCKWNGIPQFEAKDIMPELKRTGKNHEPRPNQHYPIYHGADPDDKLAPHLMTIQSKKTKEVNIKNQGYPLYYDKTDGYGEYKLERQTPSSTGMQKCVANQHYPLFVDGYQAFQKGFRVEQRPNQLYPLHHNQTKISLTPFPDSIEVKPMNGKELGCWRCIPATCQKLIDADMLVVKNGKIYQKQYAHYQFNKKTGQLEPFIRTMPIKTILMGESFPTNLRSNAEIKEIYGKTAFTYAKPLELVKSLLKVVSNEGDVVLDIFAGSGTTGQAAYELKREFILCQLDEGGIPDLIKIRLDKMIGKDKYEVK